MAISVALIASLALADDFKTINGKEYKNVTVSRIEPDGLVLKYKSGISKSISLSCPKRFKSGFIATVPKLHSSTLLLKPQSLVSTPVYRRKTTQEGDSRQPGQQRVQLEVSNTESTF